MKAVKRKSPGKKPVRQETHPKKIPFQFVIDELERLNPTIRPMFGCHAVYIASKIVIIVRKKEDGDPDNGVWIATSEEHHTSLRLIFPSLRNIRIFGEKKSSWQMLPEDAPDFEESAFKACQLILKGDSRIGKIPKPKKKAKV